MPLALQLELVRVLGPARELLAEAERSGAMEDSFREKEASRFGGCQRPLKKELDSEGERSPKATRRGSMLPEPPGRVHVMRLWSKGGVCAQSWWNREGEGIRR